MLLQLFFYDKVALFRSTSAFAPPCTHQVDNSPMLLLARTLCISTANYGFCPFVSFSVSRATSFTKVKVLRVVACTIVASSSALVFFPLSLFLRLLLLQIMRWGGMVSTADHLIRIVGRTRGRGCM